MPQQVYVTFKQAPQRVYFHLSCDFYHNCEFLKFLIALLRFDTKFPVSADRILLEKIHFSFSPFIKGPGLLVAFLKKHFSQFEVL